MQQALLWTGILMAAVFIGCGFVFLCSDVLIDKLPKPNRTWLGVAFLAYGGFRAARQYNQFKRMKREENE